MNSEKPICPYCADFDDSGTCPYQQGKQYDLCCAGDCVKCYKGNEIMKAKDNDKRDNSVNGSGTPSGGSIPVVENNQNYGCADSGNCYKNSKPAKQTDLENRAKDTGKVKSFPCATCADINDCDVKSIYQNSDTCPYFNEMANSDFSDKLAENDDFETEGGYEDYCIFSEGEICTNCGECR